MSQKRPGSAGATRPTDGSEEALDPSQTDGASSATATGASEGQLRLNNIPPIYLLDTHMPRDEFEPFKDKLLGLGAPVTDDIAEARCFIGRIQQPRRAKMELRSLGLDTEMVTRPSQGPIQVPQKRRMSQASRSTTDSEDEHENPSAISSKPEHVEKGMVIVLKLAWLSDSVAHSRALSFQDYTVYSAKVIGTTTVSKIPEGLTSSALPAQTVSSSTSGRNIIARAMEDNTGALTQPSQTSKKYASTTQRNTRRGFSSQGLAELLHESTSEHDHNLSADLPPLPEWAVKGLKYSCQRSTPVDPPNAPFISLLKTIREARKLTADEIGVRAYSTAIAALAAYPHILTSPREILALPGCNNKIAALFVEWKNGGAHPRALAAVRDIEDDPKLQTLRLFHNIWGVGPSTARAFYARGWRDLDDAVEHGWGSLSRVQQLGLKYYDEFAAPLPRRDVEAIAAVVAQHARAALPPGAAPAGLRTCIVGGYRRGKPASGDADIVVSHVDAAATQGLLAPLVDALLRAGWVSHKLITQDGGSRRGQAPKAYSPGGGGRRNVFDGLDKALVVWQDPRFDAGAHAKNPNPHRRVDIILAPWPRVGCAVLGWSAGTTFERDLRRYAEKVKGWRFDSSGIRDRSNGKVVEVELEGGQCETIDEAERKVFRALGLEYLQPWERCTG